MNKDQNKEKKIIKEKVVKRNFVSKEYQRFLAVVMKHSGSPVYHSTSLS